jgi:HAD superfamily hydrolase (TIGR01459 family)
MAHPSRSAGTHFTDIGLTSKTQNFTSGDAVEMDLMKRFEGKKVYHLGADRNKHICKGLPITIVDNLKDADLVLLTQFIEENESVDQFDPLLEEIVRRKLTIICANPEKLVPYAKGKRYCAGTFAERLEKLGGRVEYYGKATPRMYELMSEKYGFVEENKKGILLIGDSLETDIKGASEYGVDSLLVLTGEAGKKIKTSQLAIEDYLKESDVLKGIFPQWYIQKLQW